ncbi:type IV pilus modification protein PilV [Acinetobacter ursingii]|uniref:type IV pilus modification protein PilV n=1 Tax=Acinetobacter ursingii TaxID=108980 RepID=UPI000E6AA109|nr:type IV pilus modification protein PilV [Acinetobacter ursingii]MDG9948159.1 type IV pilus modification protein PilV [Acinetobacter ursingii]
MNMKSKQNGVGLIEVLVALVLLAIGVLGFSLLQLRAIDAAQEATERTMAMSLARDLAERMRINRLGFSTYKQAINANKSETGCIAPPQTTNYRPNCNAVKMAKHDVAEILAKANLSGQTIAISSCIQSKTLHCIYISWGKTTIKVTGTNVDTSSCVNQTTGTYLADSKCLVMEAF